MTNKLDLHVTAYQGDNLYDFDNEILLNWYPQRVLHYAENARSLLELGLGHGYTVEIFSQRFNRHVVLERSSAVVQNFKEKHRRRRAEKVKTYFEEYNTE